MLDGSNHPTISETYRRLDDVLGYELQFVLTVVLPVYSEPELQSTENGCLMCCPSTKVIERSSKRVSINRKVTRRQVMRGFTNNGADKCQNGLSFKLPYTISTVTSIDSNCCRLPTAPISFEQQARVSQGHTTCRNKET